MAIKAGVWIDHKKAVVVLITDQGEETRCLKSAVAPSGRSAVRSRSAHKYGPNDFVAEDRLQRKLAGHLKKYYDEIIACIRGAASILILGPGEAKREFKKQITSKRIRGRVVELETADKMTDRQIAANVRRHYASTATKRKGTSIAKKKSSPSAKRASPSPDPGRVPRDLGGEG